MLILSTTTAEEQERFKRALEEANTIKMLIFGNGSTEESIAKKAQTREGALAMTRRVIWVQNPDLLSKAEHQLYRQGNEEITVCTLNLAGQPVRFLRSSEADSFTTLERAFAAAQQ